MRRRGSSGIRLVATAILVALVPSAPAADAAYPGANGKLAYTSDFETPQFTIDVYSINPDGSERTRLTHSTTGLSRSPNWSPDGSRLAFTSTRTGTRLAYVMNADGSNETPVPNTAGAVDPSWSPDGSQLLFERVVSGSQSDLYLVRPDGTGLRQLTDAPGLEKAPAWSPLGDRIAYSKPAADPEGPTDVWTIDPIDESQTNLTNGAVSGINNEVDWSPDGARIVFNRLLVIPSAPGPLRNHVYVMDADGSDVSLVLAPNTNEGPEHLTGPVWSPDGRYLAYIRTLLDRDEIETLELQSMTMRSVYEPSGSGGLQADELDWQPIPYAGFPRPKAAAAVKVSLVPAYNSCSSPNRQHGPPLDSPSCNPPTPVSTAITTSAPSGSDNANLVGSFTLRSMPGIPGSPDDSDMIVQGTASDVRCLSGTTTCGNANAVGGSDYVGELRAQTVVRWTDRFNGPAAGGGTEVATIADVPLSFPFACSNTTSTAEGGMCTTSATSLNALLPGAVRDGKRTVVELGQVTVSDGGSDGDTESAPNAPFLRQGLFVP